MPTGTPLPCASFAAPVANVSVNVPVSRGVVAQRQRAAAAPARGRRRRREQAGPTSRTGHVTALPEAMVAGKAVPLLASMVTVWDPDVVSTFTSMFGPRLVS